MKILYVTQDVDFCNPLGLMQIAGISKHRGDQNYLAVLSKENLLDKISEVKPDIVAYGGCTGEHKFYVEANKKLKSSNFKDIFTIMGGPHATFFPEVLDEAELDAIYIGEGDLGYPEFLEQFDKGGDLSNLENIVVREGKLKGLKPLVQELDSLPFPDRELFYKNSQLRGEQPPVMNFMATRGCPHKCTYCFNHAFKKMYPHQKYIRRRSNDNLIEEILNAKSKINFKFVRFVDDVFVLKEDNAFKEFCKKYPKKIGLPFYSIMRFDAITPSIAESLKEAGCKVAFMSIESTNLRIRKDVLKRDMANEQIIQGNRYCRERGITVIAYTMLGLPTSTLEDDINAVDFSIKANVAVPEFPVYQPLPKTELFEICKAKDFFDEKEISSYGFTKRSILNCFTDKEKNAQINISTLGPLAVKHPYLRNLIMNHLIYFKYNSLFKKIYALDKFVTYHSKVYRMNYSMKERFKIFKKAFKMEKIRRSEK